MALQPQTFDDLFTHSRLGNATMTDSDGLLKWAPHNLLTYSEQFDNGAWTKSGSTTVTTNAATAPDGTLTADRVEMPATSGTAVLHPVTLSSLVDHTFKIFVKATSSDCSFDLAYAFGGGTVQLGTVTATSSWQEFSLEVSTSVTTLSGNIIINNGTDSYASDILVWGAHLYRSDLGGMAPVPLDARVAGSTTYVPTTSTAVYLPRRGDHRRNAATGVWEPALLIEGSASTNVITYSEDLSDVSWSKSSTLSIGTPVTRKGIRLDEVVSTTGESYRFVASTDSIVAANGDFVSFSFYVENIDATNSAFRISDVPGSSTTNRVTSFLEWSGGVPTLSGPTTSGLTHFDSHVEDLGDGLYRVSMVVQNATGGALTLYGVAYHSWNVDEATSLYMGGFQFEALDQVSSYMPTMGVAVTRAADTGGLTIDPSTLSGGVLPGGAMPSEVSILVDVEASFIDRGFLRTVRLVDWTADASNRLELRIDTQGARTGRLQASTVASTSAENISETADDYYTPGVFVPIKAAMRVGADYVQACYEGTPGYNNPNPTALPDLSSATFKSGNNSRPLRIKKILIWSDDVGAAGLAEATS